MMDYVIMVVITFGALFVLLAAIGIVRMPDLYLRISVTTKAATLGVGMILIAAAVYFGEASMTTRALAIVFFLLLTAPVAAHLIGKASYFVGIPLWRKTVLDDLKDSEDTHSLLGIDEEDEDADKKDDSQKPESEV
ncbi:monovalent cation/H(+) antiporter subunit G [Cryomorpha ignava]|uniref:Monovalent cation/H(+) antiporter subunit G n=1 Tax=Cryomorpha ignava TaxID=101383 RepID=A0A7K3WVN2_9FLAO|nr:monovalent cation/H(+) antiporter subunit G [Cryomorpha ignava]NEN24665.1 monovalent cation/H(+) antiporter subunit G [Cryomorpha ignava]